MLSTEEGSRDSALKIDGVLLKIFVEPVVGFWSTVIESGLGVKLVATSRTGLRAERTFFVKGDLESVIWTQGLFNDPWNGAAGSPGQDGRGDSGLMKQYPEPGFAPPLPGWLVMRREAGQ